MLSIKDKDGNYVDYVSGDDVLDMERFQKRNPQQDIIEKMLTLWNTNHQYFDQSEIHYEQAQIQMENGSTFEDYPLYTNWLAITFWNIHETEEVFNNFKYIHNHFDSLIIGLNEMFGVENILKHIHVFQLFLTPPAPQMKLRKDWESENDTEWTESKWREQHENNFGQPLYNYHHDPYNFIWLKLDESKRLITRNVNKDNVVVRSNSVISFDGFMHEGDPSSWGISMRLSLLSEFWENQNHESEICRNLVNHVRQYEYIPAFPKNDGAADGQDWGLSFLDYNFINKNADWLSDDEYCMDNWQSYCWWDSEPALKFLEELKKYRRTK